MKPSVKDIEALMELYIVDLERIELSEDLEYF